MATNLKRYPFILTEGVYWWFLFSPFIIKLMF